MQWALLDVYVALPIGTIDENTTFHEQLAVDS
jgi:hypothetical protein